MSEKVFKDIKEFLDGKNIEYSFFRHKAVRTSKEAAEVRDMSVEEGMRRGAKAMVIRSEGEFYQFVLPASKKLDFDSIREVLDSRSVSLADPEEVEEITDCKPGAVPPFGNLFGIPVYVDPSLLENEEIDFNAGLRTVSMEMKAGGWKEAVQPQVVEFAR